MTTARVHSRHDFTGDAQAAAQAAFERVRVTQPCENGLAGARRPR